MKTHKLTMLAFFALIFGATFFAQAGACDPRHIYAETEDPICNKPDPGDPTSFE